GKTATRASPAASSTRPRKRRTSCRASVSYASSRASHCVSPSSAARRVGATMAVNITLVRPRSGAVLEAAARPEPGAAEGERQVPEGILGLAPPGGLQVHLRRLGSLLRMHAVRYSNRHAGRCRAPPCTRRPALSPPEHRRDPVVDYVRTARAGARRRG